MVNALLAEIDGVESRAGVVLVAACNHPDRLDPALIRSGRLDRHIRIALPDLIISDLNMPEMSGFELLSVLRVRFPAIPVVAISGAGYNGEYVAFKLPE